VPRPPSAELSAFLYRRVAPPNYKIKKNEVSPQAFIPGPDMRGLSVFRADMASPRQVLEARIEDERAKLASPDPAVRERAEIWIDKNSTVEALVDKQYRVIEIPISAVISMGFRLEEPDEIGHLNILGSPESFDAHQLDFVELIVINAARVLTAEECLAFDHR
jgi:hypothetical protein